MPFNSLIPPPPHFMAIQPKHAATSESSASPRGAMHCFYHPANMLKHGMAQKTLPKSCTVYMQKQPSCKHQRWATCNCGCLDSRQRQQLQTQHQAI